MPISSAINSRLTFVAELYSFFLEGEQFASMAAAAFFASKGARGARVVAIRLCRASAV